MKKLSFFLTILICFGLIACDNAGTKAKVGRDGDITVEKLIAGMPTSIEEFEAQSNSGRSIEVILHPVNFETTEGIMTHGYKNITGLDFSYVNLFMTILKNDLISQGLEFDTVTNISDVAPESEASTELFNSLTGGQGTWQDILYSLGKIEATFDEDDGIVNVKWVLDVKAGDTPEGSDPEHIEMVVFIKGTYLDGVYKDFFCAVDYGSILFESYKHDGKACVVESSFYRDDGAQNKAILKKEGSDFVFYGIGSSDLENPSQEILESASHCRWIRYKNSTGAAEFKNGKRGPEWNLYEVYDTDGSLMFSQDKREEEWKDRDDKDHTKFEQIIPFKYLRTTRAVRKLISVDGEESDEDNPYYVYDDDSQLTQIKRLKNVEFEVGPAIHESFPCYVTTSDSKSVINIESPFSFTKTDDTLAAIAKLDAYVAETYTENFTKALVSAEEIDEIKSAIVAWLAEISE